MPIPADSTLELRIDHQAAGLQAGQVMFKGTARSVEGKSVLARLELAEA